MLAKPLNRSDLAGLHTKFVLPLVVQDMLRGMEALDDVAEFSMHDMLGELQPDTALLCVALCAQHLGAHTAHVALGKTIGTRAEKIIEEYGALWIAHESGQTEFDNETMAEILIRIPEDLEEMGDLLLALCGELGEDMAVAAILCDILGTEAHLHMEFAEMKLEALALLDHELPELPAGASGVGFSDNVVVFPGAAQAVARKA